MQKPQPKLTVCTFRRSLQTKGFLKLPAAMSAVVAEHLSLAGWGVNNTAENISRRNSKPLLFTWLFTATRSHLCCSPTPLTRSFSRESSHLLPASHTDTKAHSQVDPQTQAPALAVTSLHLASSLHTLLSAVPIHSQ